MLTKYKRMHTLRYRDKTRTNAKTGGRYAHGGARRSQRKMVVRANPRMIAVCMLVLLLMLRVFVTAALLKPIILQDTGQKDKLPQTRARHAHARASMVTRPPQTQHPRSRCCVSCALITRILHLLVKLVISEVTSAAPGHGRAQPEQKYTPAKASYTGPFQTAVSHSAILAISWARQNATQHSSKPTFVHTFFLSWVSKTQPNHWTKRMANTRLTT